MADKKDNSVVNIPDFLKNIPSRKLEDIHNPKFVLGDTPEQLNVKCANWVDAIVVDGKVYTTQHVKNLLAERDALADALEFLLNEYIALANSGDAGNWLAEETPEGIKAIAALSSYRGGK